MRCPYCNHIDSKVIDSRPIDEGASIRRRRECTHCHNRFTTYERVEAVPLMVVKKDKSTQVFDRNKIISGLLRSCEKRPVSRSDMEALVDDIESELNNQMIQEISSKDLGEMVLTRLRDLDEVAYVRFASVYRRFNDVESFMQELKTLTENKKE